MRSTRIAVLLLVALLVLCFGLAANLDTWFQGWQGNRSTSGNLLNVMLGDGRRMFANHFFVKADAYFHSGFYPTVYDNNEAFQTPHMAEDTGGVKGHNQGDESTFLGKPRDWIDAFSRKFFPAVHTHLDEGGAQPHSAASGDLGQSSQVREILPWLRLSADLDPSRVETYTVTAYWLRRRMAKVTEAEQFLREGLQANPNSFEIMFELGRVYAEDRHDPRRARNLWEAALLQWEKQESGKTSPNEFLCIEIASRLSELEARQGDYDAALRHMALWKQHSPDPAAVQKHIEEVEQKITAGKTAPSGATADERHREP